MKCMKIYATFFKNAFCYSQSFFFIIFVFVLPFSTSCLVKEETCNIGVLVFFFFLPSENNTLSNIYDQVQ